MQFITTRQPFKRTDSQQQHGSCENETKLCAVRKRLKSQTLCPPRPLHACVCTCGSRNRWSVNSIRPVSIRTRKQTTADCSVTKVIPKVTHFRGRTTFSATGLYHPHEHHLFHERRRMERGNNKQGMECRGKAKIKLKPLVQLTSCPQDLQLFHILCSTRSHQSRTLKRATVCKEIATSSRHYATLALGDLSFWTVCGATKASSTKIVRYRFCCLVRVQLHSPNFSQNGIHLKKGSYYLLVPTNNTA